MSDKNSSCSLTICVVLYEIRFFTRFFAYLLLYLTVVFPLIIFIEKINEMKDILNESYIKTYVKHCTINLNFKYFILGPYITLIMSSFRMILRLILLKDQ